MRIHSAHVEGTKLIIAKITKDHLSDEFGDEYDQTGREFFDTELEDWWGWADGVVWPSITVETKFRMYDDDGELHYSGWLIDDDSGITQQLLGNWAAAYSGCTVIKVMRNGKFVQEIS